MMSIKFNPFNWHKSSEMVKSSVISLELQRSNMQTISVSDLDRDIEIIIPMHGPPMITSDATEYNFLKPNKISTHSYYAELADVPVFLKLRTEAKDIVIEIFVKFGSRPTIKDFDYNFVVRFNSECKSQADVEQSETSCPLDETSMTLVPSKPSLLYFGLLFLGAKNVTEHSRTRRSCFGHGRERRSCVGVKDPPLKGVYKTDVPQHDPSADVNYTFRITQSSCLYWSEDEDKWSSHSCKVILILEMNNIGVKHSLHLGDTQFLYFFCVGRSTKRDKEVGRENCPVFNLSKPLKNKKAQRRICTC